MKGLEKKFSSILFIFGLIFLFSACNQSNDNNKKMGTDAKNLDLSGVWIVTNKSGNKFDITLNKDGTATSTWSVLDKGKWKVVNEKKARVEWNSGAHEFIIIDDQGKAERQTFAPGDFTEGNPIEVNKIEKK